MLEKMLKTSEIAQILGVSKSFAYQLIRSGEIVSLRMGKAVRVRPVDLEKYITSNVSSKHADEIKIQAQK